MRETGRTVEPDGAAATALVLSGRLPVALVEGRSAGNPLRVLAVVSGGNPDPAQLARVTSSTGSRSDIAQRERER